MSDCGCSNPSPIVPPGCIPSGLAICDSRFLTLGSVTPGRILVIGPNGQCMQFLAAAGTVDAPLSGLVVMGADGRSYVTREPMLTLPLINPLSTGAYPSTNVQWARMLVAPAHAGENAWQMVAAPSAGDWLVSVSGGLFKFTEATSGGGASTAVCQTDASVGKITLNGCYNTGTNDTPVWAIRKLTPVMNRVVVGIVPGDGSFNGHRHLPDDVELQHPLLRITTQARFTQIVQLDPATTNPFTNGLGTTVAFGTGAITDTMDVVYSPTDKTLRFRPAPIYKCVSINVTSRFPSSGSLPSAYTQLTGGHCQSGNIDVHSKNLMIFATVNLNGTGSGDSAPQIDWAIFRDGSLLAGSEMTNAGDTRTRQVNVMFIDENVPPGTHSYELRIKRFSTGYADAQDITSSKFVIISLPN